MSALARSASAPRVRPVLRPVALAASLALLPLAAVAQSAAPPASAASAAAAGDGLGLDTVVVTGTTSAMTKMRTSVSLSTLDGGGIVTSTATSAADVLRSIPGLRSESSGGESNANVGVRGIPISAGGSRYIQFQEDGLPVLQFGDIAFATPDTWVRADVSLDRLEVLRGGSASTLATGAPGGIINFITKTGDEPGGSFAVTKGLGYDETRFDLGYGGPISDKTRFWVGGFYHSGDGGRPGAAGTEGGGQIRGNITHQLPGGFVRLSFQHLDDRTPTFLPTPVRYVNGRIVEIPGIDPRKAAFYNAGWPLDSTLTIGNGRATSNIADGLRAKTDAIGAVFDIDAGGGLHLQNNFRWSRNSGRFIGIFPGTDVTAAPAGSTIATGAGAGSAYNGDQFTAVVFNTQVDDVGLVANDLKLSKDFAFAGGKLTATGGLYTSVQNLKLTWNFNQYSLSASGQNARLLNVPGVVNGSPGFGGCCSNSQDSRYKTNAPYLNLGWVAGPLSVDASVRRDNNSARGVYYQSNAGVSYNLAQPNIIDYGFSHDSYSLGTNYELSKDLALFGRVSQGAAYNADRITFFNPPALVNGTSSRIPINEVKQLEGGAKWRIGSVSVFATLFYAKTDEVNVDPTTTPVTVINNKYDSKGLELESAWRAGLFALRGGLTYTNARITASTDPTQVGLTPKRQAKVVYQLTPSVYLGDSTELGASIVGTSSSRDDSPAGPLTVTLPAFATVNAFASYALTPQASVLLAVNNLFNTIGYTESNNGRGAARAINGRTAKVSLKYNF
ncbi:MAG: TonB-dependent receptor [Burkholderiales bacterium]|nr:TonB-dependent receptor [Burkholderiales bacterium]